MHHLKVLEDYLLLLILLLHVLKMLKQAQKTIKSIFLQEKKLKITTYGRNFYDQPINYLIIQHDQVRKVSIGQDDDCTTGSLLDYANSKMITD